MSSIFKYQKPLTTYYNQSTLKKFKNIYKSPDKKAKDNNELVNYIKYRPNL